MVKTRRLSYTTINNMVIRTINCPSSKRGQNSTWETQQPERDGRVKIKQPTKSKWHEIEQFDSTYQGIPFTHKILAAYLGSYICPSDVRNMLSSFVSHPMVILCLFFVYFFYSFYSIISPFSASHLCQVYPTPTLNTNPTHIQVPSIRIHRPKQCPQT